MPISEAGLTDFSETDRMIYTVLSNPERIDLDMVPPARGVHATHEGRFEELPPVQEEAVYPPPPRGRGCAPAAGRRPGRRGRR